MIQDLKDNIVGSASQLKDRILESSTFNQLKDRYENLSPFGQKGALVATILIFLVLLFYWPLSSLSSSFDYVNEFEGKRDLIRELLKVTKEASELPALPQAPPLAQVQMTLENYVRDANLLPEQFRGVTQIRTNSKLIPESRSQGSVKAEFSKLNLRQIVQLSSQMQNLGASVKMSSLRIEANSELSQYFDLVLTFTSLKVPVITRPTILEPRGRGIKKNNKTPPPLPEDE
ncbi:MAG: hypothetical protein IPK04_22965 [Bdellovibrionales bacterium]|jgi:hypothetical protein|nr:hypothetical protein [Bdellovibrionales bacterium]